MKIILENEEKSFLINLFIQIEMNEDITPYLRIHKAVKRRLLSNSKFSMYNTEQATYVLSILRSLIKIREAAQKDTFETLPEEIQEVEATINSIILVIMSKFVEKSIIATKQKKESL